MTRINKRRRILIDRLQYHLLAINLFYTTVVALVFAVLLFAPLVQELLLQDVDSVERSQAAAAFLILHQRVWPPLIVALVCLAIHSLIVSHRIAGPLYHFRRVLGRLSDGDLTTRARLRRKDYLTTEAEVINQMTISLERKVLDLQRHGLDLCGGLQRLEREVRRQSTPPSESVEQLMKALDERAEAFRNSIVEFKTGDVHHVAESVVDTDDDARAPHPSKQVAAAEA